MTLLTARRSTQAAAMRSLRRLRSLSVQTRIALCLLLVFGTLVAAQIHGSSFALTSKVWAPKSASSHFVAASFLKQLDPDLARVWRGWLGARPQFIRLDEWAHQTAWSIAPFSHSPRFPVINENIGNGQNMLTAPWVPVWHASALARPMTWGYLAFGATTGLAWAWWWEFFSGLVSVFLLLGVVLKGRPWLALLGASWFAGSAYVILWSMWPSYMVSFGAFAVFSGYHAMKAETPIRSALACFGLGVSFSGFVTQLYPPWQVPLGQLFALLFFGLTVRDRLWTPKRWWLVSLAVLTVTVALTLGSFLFSSADALAAFSGSDYPGLRRLHGGDSPSHRLFSGVYNYFTKVSIPKGLNASEAAGFFLFFPAVGLAAIASPSIRKRLDLTAWLMLVYAGMLVLYGELGFPQWLADITLLSRSQGFRAQIALGLASIIVCTQLLAASTTVAITPKRRWILGLLVFFGGAALFLVEGARFHAAFSYFQQIDPSTVTRLLGGILGSPLPHWVLWVALASGLCCALLAIGWARGFAMVLFPALLLTSGDFNPVSRGFPDWRQTELGQAIQRTLSKDRRPGGKPSLWLTYGGSYPNAGVVATMMGARALGGVYEYPQVDVWEPYDSTGTHRSKYNRYAVVNLIQKPLGTSEITFRLPYYLTLHVSMAADNRRLWEQGARYVLALEPPVHLHAPSLKLLERGKETPFSIWEIQEPPNIVR